MKHYSLIILVGLFFCVISSPANASVFTGDIDCSWSNEDNWQTLNPTPPPDYLPGLPGPGDGVSVSNTTICLDTPYMVEISSFNAYGHVNFWVETPRNPCLKMSSLSNHGHLNINSYKNREIFITSKVINHIGATLEIIHWFRFSDLPLIQNEGEIAIMFSGMLECEETDLDNSGHVYLNSNNIFKVNNVNNTNTIGCSGGRLDAEGAIANSGTIEGWGMVEASTGDFLNGPGGSVNVYFGTLRMVAPGFINQGSILNYPNSDIQIAMTGAQSMVNQNLITINAGGGMFVHGDITNLSTGTASNPSPTIQLKGGHLAANTIYQQSGATLSGFGSITANIDIADSGRADFTGPTNVIGDLTVGANAFLYIKDGQTLITGQTTNNGTIYVIGGTVVFQGGLTGSGNVVYQSSASSNAADFDHNNAVDGKDLSIFVNEFGWQAN